MNFFPNILAVLAILLPPGSGETFCLIGRVAIPVHASAVGSPASDLIFCPIHLPPASESFVECLDESAFDEEDSDDGAEDHGMSTLTFLDFETPLTNDLLLSYLPANPHSQSAVITPILRC